MNQELFDLSMSDAARPLLERVVRHLKDNVAPWYPEWETLNIQKEDRWSWHLRQIELIEGAKTKAREARL